jgi:hypothetical protein
MFANLIEELMEFPIDDLDEALASAKLAREQAELQIAAITAIVQAKQAHVDHGHRSLNAYLKQQLNCSSSQARTIRRRARLVNEHPQIADALAAGRIGVGQVDRLAIAAAHPRAGHRFGEFASMLTDHAERLEYDEFLIAVKHFEMQADPDGAFDDQRFHEDERTASVAVSNGAVDVHASGGDPIAATEIKAVFDRAVEAEVQKDFATRRNEYGDDALAHPLPRTAKQRAFDALHQIFIDSAMAPADGLRPEPLVNFVIDPTTGIDVLVRHGFLDVDVETGAEQVDPATRLCATTTGTPVHPDVALRAMVRGSIRRVVVDAHNVVIDHGRKQRLFTGAARDAARLLAVRCGHRGCDVPAEFCDIDHVDEWAADHGETNQANALPLCGSHDRWKHRKRLRGRRDRHGRVHLIRPDDTVIKPLGARDPEWESSEPKSGPADRHVATRTIARTMSWAEFTKGQLPTRGYIDPSATVRLVEFPSG